MNRIPVIDMTATGINITRLRVNAGLTVKDLQDIFGFSTPRPFTSGSAEQLCRRLTTSLSSPQFSV